MPQTRQVDAMATDFVLTAVAVSGQRVKSHDHVTLYWWFQVYVTRL